MGHFHWSVLLELFSVLPAHLVAALSGRGTPLFHGWHGTNRWFRFSLGRGLFSGLRSPIRPLDCRRCKRNASPQGLDDLGNNVHRLLHGRRGAIAACRVGWVALFSRRVVWFDQFEPQRNYADV